MFRTLLRVIVWARLCLLLHLWSHCSLLRNLGLLLKLFDITSTRRFQGVLISPGTCLLLNSTCKFGGFSHSDHTLLVQLSVSVFNQRLKFNHAGETGNRASKFVLSRSFWRTENHRSNSLFHDLNIRFDRHAADAHELFRVSIHFECLSLFFNGHVHCIGGPTQIRLLSFLLRLFLCIV